MEDQQDIDFTVCCGKITVKFKWYWEDYIKLAYLLNNPREAQLFNTSEDFRIKFEAPRSFSLKTKITCPEKRDVRDIMDSVKQVIACNKAAQLEKYMSKVYKTLPAYISKTELSRHKQIYAEEYNGVIYVAVDNHEHSELQIMVGMMDVEPGSSGRAQTDQTGMQASGGSGSGSQKPQGKSSIRIEGSMSWFNAGTTVQVVRGSGFATHAKYVADVFKTSKPTAEVKSMKKEERFTIHFPVQMKTNTELDEENLKSRVYDLLKTVESDPVEIPLDCLKHPLCRTFLKTFLESVLLELKDEADFGKTKQYSIIFCISDSDTIQDAIKVCDKSLQIHDGWKKKEEFIDSRKQKKGIEIKLIQGLLENSKADILACTLSEELDLRKGQASKALLKAAGKGIQQELDQNYGTYIPGGRIAVTSGGNLSCQHLFFGVLYPYDTYHDEQNEGLPGYARTSVLDFMMLCLKSAEKKEARTIAFPVLGSGMLQYPVDAVCEAMFEAVEMYNTIESAYSLQQVIFVVYPKDGDAWEVFNRRQNYTDTDSTSTGNHNTTFCHTSTNGQQNQRANSSPTEVDALENSTKKKEGKTLADKKIIEKSMSLESVANLNKMANSTTDDDKNLAKSSYTNQRPQQMQTESELELCNMMGNVSISDKYQTHTNSGIGVYAPGETDLSSSVKTSGNAESIHHIKGRITIPSNISKEVLGFFFKDILNKYNQKGFFITIQDDCLEYEGPANFEKVFKTEFRSARSKFDTGITTDTLDLGQSTVNNDVDCCEFEKLNVFVENVPDKDRIDFYGHQWNDIQTVKQKYIARFFPHKVTERGQRHLDQEHLNANKHAENNIDTYNKSEKGETSLSGENIGTEKGARQKSVAMVRSDEFSWSRHTSDLTVYSVKNVTVKVYSADILHVPVDCIVNAANSQLDHHGGVAKFIAKAAGKKLKQEGEDYIKKHGSLKVGEVCHTSAGKLPYKHVIHAVGPCWSWYKPHAQADVLKCENDLRMAIKKSLSKAKMLGHSSIAIPAVSSGKFGCPEYFCAVQYAYAILDYVSASRLPIQEIHFVDTNKAVVKVIHNTFKAMLPKGKLPKDYDREKYVSTTSQLPPKKKGLKRVLSVPSKPTQEKTRLRTTYQDDYGQPYPYCEPPSQFPAGHEVFACFFADNKKLLVYTDNILTLKKKIDMKACGENASGNGKGFLSSEFAIQGEVSYQSAKRTAFKGKKPGDVVVCKADKNHKCKFIAHVVLPQGTDDDTKMNSTFRELFKAMVTNKCETLALPLLGTGKARLPATYVIKRLYESLKEFSKASGNKTHPIVVHLVSRDRDTNIVISTIQGEVGNVRASQATGYDRRTGPDTHSSTGASGARPKSASIRHKHPSNTTEHQPSTRAGYERSKTETYLPSQNHKSPSNRISIRDSDESDFSSENEHTNRRGQWKLLDRQSSADTEQSSMSASQKGKKGNLQIFHSDSEEEDSANACQRLKPSDEKTVQKPAADVDSDSSGSDVDNCVICMDVVTDPKTLSCGHKFCTDCIDAQFAYKKVCPTCGAVCGIITGDQPDGTMDVYTHTKYPGCAGYEKYGKIQITYTFQNGVQQSNHPSPGQSYRGIKRTGYLPDTKRGRQILEMLRVAFKRKLVFTIGNSRTTGQQGVITWNDIHHKTDPSPNTPFGYPDPTYLDRVEDELKAKGVTVADIKSSPDVYRSTKM